jgi:hypothetical protein
MRVEIKGQEELARRLANIPQQFQNGVLRKVAQQVFGAAQKGADRHTKTGALRQSVFLKPIPGNNGYLVGLDERRAPYARYVHEGTRPHVIESKPYPFPVYFMRKTKTGKVAPYLKRKKSLRWAHGNNFIFAEKVFHPGYKGDKFLEQAVQAGINYVKREYGNS